MRPILEAEQKALEINLNEAIYGSFAEIGAGQEVARYFFQAGAAAGTIAKSMSAYDKTYSDQIYGSGPSGRYVCESRVYTMLDHEYALMEERLQASRPGQCFFVFADTIAAINYQKTIAGDGWLGLRFQLDPESRPNDLVLHVRMLDNDNRLQQQAVGMLGVNLVYACYYYSENLDYLLESLMDGLQGRVQIDMLHLQGPDFRQVDNRVLALQLVQAGLTDVAIFNAAGKPVHGSEFLYKKEVMVMRASFAPFTNYHQDVLQSGFRQFEAGADPDAGMPVLLTELTLDSLRKQGPIDTRDYLDRVSLLCALGHTVVVSNCLEFENLNEYLLHFKVRRIGLLLHAKLFLRILEAKFAEHRDGTLLSSIGNLFSRRVQIFLYPAYSREGHTLLQADSLPVPAGMHLLYQHLLENRLIEDVEGYDPRAVDIFTLEVLRKIQADEAGWEELVPPVVAEQIKTHCRFGYPCRPMQFEY